MKLMRLMGDIHPELEYEIRMLAVRNARDLISYPMEADNPLTPLAEAEVSFRLRSDLDLIDRPVMVEGVMTRGEIIVAIDESSAEENQLAGFITFKPRFPAFNCVTIAYVVVAEPYRRQGVMRKMMEELLRHYPVAGLDCDVSLVPVYEKFGFYPAHVQGCHIGMQTAPLNGRMVHFDNEDVQQSPEMKAAKQFVQRSFGEQRKVMYSRLNEQITLALEATSTYMSTRVRG